MLIADEPTTALDVTIQAQVLSLMLELKKKYETSMLLITHDLGVVAEICDRVAIMYAGRIMEEGSLRQVFKYPAHPYTKGLFGSLPDIHKKTRRLQPISGSMPDPTMLPPGCAFADRCPYCRDACHAEVPEIMLADGHKVRCILAGGKENG